MIPDVGRVLGLDPGSARIGVAISDTEQRVSSSLRTIPRSGDAAADRRALARLVAEEEAVGVVVGLPLSLSGAVGPAAEGVLRQIELWAPAMGVPVETVDERFTTVVAHRALRAGGGRAGNARARVDVVAATVLLQSWLERRQSARSTVR